MRDGYDFGPPNDQEKPLFLHCVFSGDSSSSLSSFEDVESPGAPLEEMEEDSLDDSFVREAPTYDIPKKQKKMSREASRKQAVRE